MSSETNNRADLTGSNPANGFDGWHSFKKQIERASNKYGTHSHTHLRMFVAHNGYICLAINTSQTLKRKI